jgi:predicted RNA-binding Zn ribbon-like protein
MADPEFTFLGDAIWLDFVNTARARTTPSADLLADLAAYHRWAKAQKLHSDADEVAFAELLDFRERLTALAEALDRGRQAPATAISAVNGRLSGVTGHRQLTRVAGSWIQHFSVSGQPPALAAIAASAAATVADPRTIVRLCAGTTCSLFFSDDSPRHSRHLCSAACGRSVRLDRRRARYGS